MTLKLTGEATAGAKPVHLLFEGDPLPETLSETSRGYARAVDFRAKAGEALVVPDASGEAAALLFGRGARDASRAGPDPSSLGRLSSVLPAGSWAIVEADTLKAEDAVALLLGSYRFTRYLRDAKSKEQTLALGDAALAAEAHRIADACFLTRDLVNTPTNDMLPDDLEAAARELALRFDAEVKVTVGNALLDANFPLIHAVGRASAVAPRLIDMVWGDASAPKVTLVGKGVCFDTGGLDIKPASSMLLMKKDMGGAAHVLGLAQMIMAAKLNLRLRVLIPAVENAIAGNAFRPGDVLSTRKGMSVEIGNTDAEGRLVLADALTLACEEQPDLLVDMATLTGAARVALGPDIPPVFTDDEALAADLASASAATFDPVWRLPLHAPYRRILESKIADINNAGSGGFAGAITAALFLKEFVEPRVPWMHFDVFAWTPTAKPTCPVGGEAQAIRALDHLLRRRYAR